MIIPLGFFKKDSATAPTTYPAYRGTGGVVQNATSDVDTIDVTVPTGTVDNDIMIMVVFNSNSSYPHVIPSGWTRFAYYTPTYGEISYLWKRASSESSTITVEKSNYNINSFLQAKIWSFSDAITTGTPFENLEEAGLTSLNENTWSFTNLSSGDKRLACVFWWQNDNRATTVTPTGGYVDQDIDIGDYNYDMSTALATMEIADSSTVDGSVTYTHTAYVEDVYMLGFYLIPNA